MKTNTDLLTNAILGVCVNLIDLVVGFAGLVSGDEIGSCCLKRKLKQNISILRELVLLSYAIER